MKKMQEPGGSKWWFIVMFLLLLWMLSHVGALVLSFGDSGASFGNVAVIPIKGIIVSDSGQGLFGQEVVSSEEIISMIERADADLGIEAIMLDINSPGGAPVPTKDIANALGRVNKSTYTFIRDVGASGGYWIASATDKIVASEMSITGSIGVMSSYLEFSGLLASYNVSYERLVAGQHKDIGSPFKELTTKERGLLESQLEMIYDIFVEEVAANRGLSVEEVRKLANGMYYLGIRAKELGLIDEVGDIKKVEAIIREDLGIESIEFVSYRKSRSLLSVLSQVFSEHSFYVGKGIGSQLVQEGKVSSKFDVWV